MYKRMAKSATPSIGDSVTLVCMQGEPQMKEGLTGTVYHIDDAGQIHVHWINGSSLALIPGTDRFTVEKSKGE